MTTTNPNHGSVQPISTNFPSNVPYSGGAEFSPATDPQHIEDNRTFSSRKKHRAPYTPSREDSTSFHQYGRETSIPQLLRQGSILKTSPTTGARTLEVARPDFTAQPPVDENVSRFCPRSCCSYTSLQRQVLPARGHQVITGKLLVVYCLGTAFLCTIVALLVGLDTATVIEQKIRFDDCALLGAPCTKTMLIENDMTAPIYVYYSYKTFYQNHRRYLKSMSQIQLMGSTVEQLKDEGDPSSKECKPDVLGSSLGKTLYPCGMLAYTFPPDRITAKLGAQELCSECLAVNKADPETEWQQAGSWDKANIAYESDVTTKFKWTPLNNTSFAESLTRTGYPELWYSYNRIMPRTNDKDLMNWFRGAALPNFKKLYRIISTKDLKKGDTLEFTIYNYFDSSKYGAEKWLVINTLGTLGGDNTFLMGLAIFTTTLCLLSACFVIFRQKQARSSKLP